ncbi:O-methyltransferase [Halobacillus sp. B23F22_1]|uniref:O-methyltransferase n=1 Tax=Halobacillus sp. B23F22_1 TaxID=3459514 RepID=UPI00373EF354
MKNEEYLQSLLPPVSKEIKDLEIYAAKHKIPIMEPLGIDFLMQLIRIHKPRKILEIGTAIGYSALRMLEAYQKAEIITIERDSVRYEEAKKNFNTFDKEKQIHLIHGDALDVKDEVVNSGLFDLIFIDAAKGKYEEFFNLYAPLLKDSGIIVSDNVLFKGAVAHPEEAPERLQKLACKVRTFNQLLKDNNYYHTSIVPIGDGVAITVKA